jgi:hypothetical protein
MERPFNHLRSLWILQISPPAPGIWSLSFLRNPPRPLLSQETRIELEAQIRSPGDHRRRPWWPVRLLTTCSASAVWDASVAYFGDPVVLLGPTKQVLRFVDPDADDMARPAPRPPSSQPSRRPTPALSRRCVPPSPAPVYRRVRPLFVQATATSRTAEAEHVARGPPGTAVAATRASHLGL